MQKKLGTLHLIDLCLGGSQRIDFLSLGKSVKFAVVFLLNQYQGFVADTIECLMINSGRVKFVLSVQLTIQLRQK
jgi:hypothetical protein